MQVVTRAEWRARRPRHVTSIAPDRPSTVHWNGPVITVRGETIFPHAHCAALVRGIQNFHMDSQGWSDIAYNFVVCQHGIVFEGRGMNYQSGANGTTVGNRSSLAVMYLGGTTNPFPTVTRVAIREVVAWIGRSTSAPDRAMVHRDWKTTECPGGIITTWVRSGMPTHTSNPNPPPPPIQEFDDMLAATIAVIEWSYVEAGFTLGDPKAAQAKSKWISEARAKALRNEDPWDVARTARDQLGLSPDPTWPT